MSDEQLRNRVDNTRAAVDMLVDLVEVQLSYILDKSYGDDYHTEERKQHLQFFNAEIQAIRTRLYE